MTDLSVRKNSAPSHKSKSRQILVINQLKRKVQTQLMEEQWNNRFNVRPARESRRLEEPPSPSEIKPTACHLVPGKPRRPRPESNRRVVPSQYQEKRLSKQIVDLQTAWGHKQVPEFYQSLFIKGIQPVGQLNQNVAMDIVSRESELLAQNNSIIQRCMVAVSSRENYTLKQNKEEVDVPVQSANELITHLRILSLNVVEQVCKMREHLQSIYNMNPAEAGPSGRAICIPYIHEGQNYLLKLRSDLSFLVGSCLNQYFHFSLKTDPFLLYTSQHINHPASNKIVHFISNQLLVRIRQSEKVILDETVQQMMIRQSQKSIRPVPKPFQHQNKYQRGIRIPSNQSNTSHLPPKQPVSRQRPSAIKKSRQLVPTEQIVKTIKTEEDDEQVMQLPQFSPEIQQQSGLTVQSRVQPEYEVQNSIELQQQEIQWQVQEISMNTSKQAMEFIREYLQGVDHEQQQTFVQMASLGDMMERQQDVFLLSVEKGGKREGMALVGWDSDYISKRRLLLHHLSARDRSNYGEVLAQVVDYLFVKDPCQEIRVGLMHQQLLDSSLPANHSVKLEVDRQILECFKALHFKWKIMNNDKYSQKRSTVYALARQHHTQQQAQEREEPVTIQCLLLLQKGKGHDIAGQVDHTALLMNSLLELGIDQESPGNLQSLLAQLQKHSTKFRFPYCRLSIHSRLDHLQSHLQQEGIYGIDKDGLNGEQPISACLMRVSCRMPSFRIVAHEQRPHFMIHPMASRSDEYLQAKYGSSDNKIYMLPTDDTQISIVLVHLDPSLQELLQQMPLHEVMMQVLSTCHHKESLQSDLLVPCFRLQEQRASGYEQYQGIHQSMGQLAYGGCMANAVVAQPRPDRVVITPPFLMGLVHDHTAGVIEMPIITFRIEAQQTLP